jgi:hypothetical protein
MKRAMTLAGELTKALASLPPLWNKTFYGYLQPVQALVGNHREVG